MGLCVLGKDTLSLFPIEDKQSNRYGGSVWRKTSQKNPKKGALRWCG